MQKEHGIYKYVYHGEIIYIGKTNSSFASRIENGHAKEKKFQPYLNEAEIYYFELPNSTEVDIAEKILINKYKPVLNKIDNHNSISNLCNVNEPIWKIYVPVCDRNVISPKKISNRRKRTITYALLDEKNWLSNQSRSFLYYSTEFDDRKIYCGLIPPPMWGIILIKLNEFAYNKEAQTHRPFFEYGGFSKIRLFKDLCLTGSIEINREVPPTDCYALTMTYINKKNSFTIESVIENVYCTDDDIIISFNWILVCKYQYFLLNAFDEWDEKYLCESF